jgi:hypothetical protein
MDKEKLDKIAKEVKKEFDYLLVALGENYHCLITADLANFKVFELENKDVDDKG